MTDILKLAIDCGIPLAVTCVLGFVALFTFFNRLAALRRSKIDYTDFLSGVSNVFSKGNVREAIALCEETKSPVAQLAKTAIENRNDPSDVLQAKVANSGMVEIARMERHLGLLNFVVRVAPAIGIVGALIGILQTVEVFRVKLPVVQTLDMTNGLTFATINSIAGVVVGLLAYAMLSVVSSRIDRVALDMAQATVQIFAMLAQKDGERK